MAAYIALGLKRQDRDVTDEKFADSCYYLGFIFTITSIVFSLFDLPNIGERIQEISVRFGAAMVSTVAGLIVRVYLVSFRQDSGDALRDAEDSVLEAAQKFREQLMMACEKFGDFQTQVTKATEASVEGVKLQIEKLSQDHSVRMERVFVELNERNQQAVASALEGVKAATERMTHAVDGYVLSMQSSLQSLGDKVDTFGQAVTNRLKTTTFPDDYFAEHLAGPVEQLKSASSEVSREVRAAANGAGEAAAVLSAAIRKLKAKTTQAEESLNTVVDLTTAQRSLFDVSASQIDQLTKVASRLAEVQQALQVATEASAVNADSNSKVQGRLMELVTTLSKVSEMLNSDRSATSLLAERVQDSQLAAQELVKRLQEQSDSTKYLSNVIRATAGREGPITALLSSLNGKADGLSTSVSAGLGQVRSMSEQIEAVLMRLVSSESVARAPATLGASGEPLTSVTRNLDRPNIGEPTGVAATADFPAPSSTPVTEPPRDSWRLRLLRRWSHEQVEEVLP